MSAEPDQHVGEGLHRREEVDASDRPTGTVRDSVAYGEEQRRHTEAVHEARRDDSLDAFVPSLVSHDQDPAAPPGSLRERRGRLGQIGLQLLTLAVACVELEGEYLGLCEVVGEEKIESSTRVAHAPRSVEARREREGDSVGGEFVRRRTGNGTEGDDARAGVGAKTLDAVGDEDAILPQKRHQVGDGAQSGKVGVVPPEIGSPKPLAESLNDLECDTGARERLGGTLGIEFRVDHRNALGNQVGGFVVIGDDHPHAPLQQPCDLIATRHAAVDGHDELGIDREHAFHRGHRQTVSLLEPQRDERVCIRAEIAQRAREEGGGGYTVEIEVPEHSDAIVRADRMLDDVGGLRKVGKQRRAEPVTCEIG